MGSKPFIAGDKVTMSLSPGMSYLSGWRHSAL